VRPLPPPSVDLKRPLSDLETPFHLSDCSGRGEPDVLDVDARKRASVWLFSDMNLQLSLLSTLRVDQENSLPASRLHFHFSRGAFADLAELAIRRSYLRWTTTGRKDRREHTT